MKLRKFNREDMATELGRTRQNVEQWLAKDADIEIMEDGRLKISIVNNVHPVHEPQVRSS